ncbi:MAG: TetR family transcriptional regulator, partial [Bacteroidetes bacterium]|nr:TetR family transcriptional regulator [Bacteroidota bacterium]
MEPKQKILHEAASLFMKFGFKSITMDDIARELGVSKKTLYQYFTDKNDLVNQTIDEHLLYMESNCSRITDENQDEAPQNFMSDIKASLSKYSWLQSVSEVQVTRRLYRSGESEFFINKVPARLKDIKELFRVLGLASRGYTIIAQGEIGRIITAKPDDRRQVIEEAAHIAGFKEHINAVAKRLEDTKGQVLRLEDVIKEVTRQVANLKRQAARA